MPLHRRRRALPSALLALALATGCAAAPPRRRLADPRRDPRRRATPAAEPARPPPSLHCPPLLRGIDLTPAQVEEALRINADLRERRIRSQGAGHRVPGAPWPAPPEEVQGASTPFVEMDAARVVRQGEELRSLRARHRPAGAPPAHPGASAARCRIASFGGSTTGRSAERRNASRTKDLGPALDLSTVQMMSMLVKAGVLWTSYADQVEPWRVKYHAAILDFARDDFDVAQGPRRRRAPRRARPATSCGRACASSSPCSSRRSARRSATSSTTSSTSRSRARPRRPRRGRGSGIAADAPVHDGGP